MPPSSNGLGPLLFTQQMRSSILPGGANSLIYILTRVLQQNRYVKLVEINIGKEI
jgi:hypothetical protein